MGGFLSLGMNELRQGTVNSPQPPVPSLCFAVREQIENFGVKLRLGMKGRMQVKVLLN